MKECDKMKILAIDDECYILRALKLQLEFKFQDSEVVTFAKASEALEYIRNNHIDICLVDFYMPEMEGTEFIRRVREFDKVIKLFILTGVNKNPADFYKDEIDGYLVKPFNFNLFKHALKETGLQGYFEEEYKLTA